MRGPCEDGGVGAHECPRAEPWGAEGRCHCDLKGSEHSVSSIHCPTDVLGTLVQDAEQGEDLSCKQPPLLGC